MMSILSKSGLYNSPVSPAINNFFRELEILGLLKKCNFNKEKGVPVIEIAGIYRYEPVQDDRNRKHFP